MAVPTVRPPQQYLPKVVAPFDPRLCTGDSTIGANVVRGVRVVVPEDGTLMDFNVFVKVSSGNAWPMILDCGDSAGGGAGTRTVLWAPVASVAFSGTAAYQSLGDPSLAVKAGQFLEFAVQASDATAQIRRAGTASLDAASHQLPSSFLVAPGGALPKLAWSRAETGFGPANFASANVISAANVGVSSIAPLIVCRLA